MIYTTSHEPQSIIHQLVRTTKNVTTKLKRGNTTRKAYLATDPCSTALASICLDDGVNISSLPGDVVSYEREGKTTEDLLNEAIQVSSIMKNTKYTSPSSLFRRSSMETAISSEPSSTEPDDVENVPEKENTSACQEESVLPLNNINQNDFMIQCMIDTSSPCLIHFYVEGCVISEMLDRELGKIHAQCAETEARCRFMRLEANAAPFITGKLQVSTQDPSIICIHNVQIFERVVDVDSLVQSPGKVQEWASGTGLLSF